MDRIEKVGCNFGKIGLSVEICSSVSEISISPLVILSIVNQICWQCITVRPKSKCNDFFSYHGKHYLIFITGLHLLCISILIFILNVTVFKFCEEMTVGKGNPMFMNACIIDSIKCS